MTLLCAQEVFQFVGLNGNETAHPYVYCIYICYCIIALPSFLKLKSITAILLL